MYKLSLDKYFFECYTFIITYTIVSKEKGLK